ncbi:hypothetical protein ACCS66_03875 [Rhizobium ruizarguesonis]
MSFIELLSTVFRWIGGTVSSDIGKFTMGAAGALFIAWFNTRLGIWRDERADKRKREGQLAYSTALLVSTLRQYMYNCMDVMNDKGEPNREGEYTDWIASRPAPKIAFPDKIDWTVFDAQLMYDALSLPSLEASEEAAVDWAYDQAFSPDRHGWIEERQLRYAELAAVAMAHLQKIHQKHPMSFTAVPIATVREITLTIENLQAAREREYQERADWLEESDRLRAERTEENAGEDEVPATPA